MTNEFKKIKDHDETRYVLETATAGATSAGVVATAPGKKREDSILAQEANKKKEATKPRNFVAKNAKMGGAGQHKDKKKAAKQGAVKHKKPLAESYAEDLAKQVFNANPNIKDENAVLDAAWPIVVKDLGNKRAMSMFNYDEDFPSDLVSVYGWLQKDQQGVTEGVNHSALQGWDEMDRKQKAEALVKAGIIDSYNTLNKTPDQLDDILHAARVKAQNQEDELSIGAGGRRELQRQAKQDFEEQRQQLHKEKMEMERFAWEKANTEAERKHEMAKIDKQYTQELRTLQMSHMQDMEKILHADTHELNKMKAEFNMRQAEREKAKPEPELQDEPENNQGNNFDQDTGEPIRPNKPQQSNQWHTSQQVGYAPNKPSKDDDVTDVEPKPNKPLAIKEKITVVKDPAKATGIQQTGGITHGSTYTPGKPLPQSLQQKLDGKSNTDRAVDAKGRTQQQWMKLVKAKFPDAKIMQSKMIDGPCFAMLSNGKKLTWNKVEQGMAEGFNGEYDDEAGMAHSNLLTSARAVMGLLKTIEDKDNLPEWVQEKIAKAEMMLVGVWDYLQSQKEQGIDPQVEGFGKMRGSSSAYDRDYASSVSGMGRGPDHRGLGQELAHETNNYAVAIDGKTWKVFADQRQAENIARSLKAKGKNATVHPTGENPSESVAEVAPPGWEKTVKAMKKHDNIDNPFALAWSMKNKGYKSHKKESADPYFESLRAKVEELAKK